MSKNLVSQNEIIKIKKLGDPMKKSMATASLLALMLISSQSYAGFYDDEETSSNLNLGGLYAGAGVGKVLSNCINTDEECNETGWKLYAGYQVNDMIALEGGYHHIADSNRVTGTFSSDAGKVVSHGADTEVTGLSASAIAKFAVDPQLDVFGRAGFMSWRKEITPNIGAPEEAEYAEKDGTDLLLGVGADYKLNENWGIRGEYEHVGGNLQADMYTLGTTFSTY